MWAGERARSGREAVIWREGYGLQSLRQALEQTGLDLGNWILVEATGISASDRTVVGWGTNPNGDPEGFVATLPVAQPAPLLSGALHGLLGLLLAAAAIGGSIRHRTHRA